jgi:RNA polymerase sigma factor (sigma-70 family)
MVLGVCRRVLRDFHDAEDAFQATFFILARKAVSVARRESVGCWLHQVAYHTALEASAMNARRRARERPVRDLPEPQAVPPEAEDWRPLLDQEIRRLPEKYRAAVVLCELEGRSRKEAARELGLPEGTLSSRLATARRLLAQRLARYGLSVAGGLTATALAGSAGAAVPASLAASTVRVALLMATGQAATATPAVALMKEVLKTMFMTKLKLAVATVLVAATAGLGGLAYRAEGQSPAPPPQAAARAPSELDALRRQNELLKLNLEVVLEKVRAQEAELRSLREKAVAVTKDLPVLTTRAAHTLSLQPVLMGRILQLVEAQPRVTVQLTPPDPVQELEAVLKALKEAGSAEAKQQAVDKLDAVTRQLRKQLKKPEAASQP